MGMERPPALYVLTVTTRRVRHVFFERAMRCDAMRCDAMGWDAMRCEGSCVRARRVCVCVVCVCVVCVCVCVDCGNHASRSRDVHQHPRVRI
jgi:hypothetical protein